VRRLSRNQQRSTIARAHQRQPKGDISMRLLNLLPLAVVLLAGPRLASAADPTLVVGDDGGSRTFTAATLLARPDSTTLTVPDDVSYDRRMEYRAVPLAALLTGLGEQRFDTLEARAPDGFVSQIPLKLVAAGANGGAVAWVAVEDPAKPWPALPHQSSSAGPFYLVWEHPERSGVRTEQWPYALASITLVESPTHRWPQLALPPGKADDATLQLGQHAFLAQCFPCHRLYGAGAGEMGPDLGLPQNATRYLTDFGLRAIIRDPRAVRTWPTQLMKGFDAAALPDAEVDAVVAYLHAMDAATTTK
jgi:mono/diheme cytochrome c family protein